MRGQALVETALVIPILLILLLGAIDFGRLFFGWVNLNQAARIGANFASTHPGTLTDPDDKADLVLLIQDETATLNCNPSQDADEDFDEADLDAEPPTYTTPGGAPTANPVLGDYARLELGCEFSMLTPLANLFFGDINMHAESTFPVREGCINCPTPAPATPPPTPIQCRTVPQMADMSVQGARLAWVSAGFSIANFTPQTGSDTSTVGPGPIVTQTPLSTCVDPLAIFDSSVEVTVVPPEAVTAGCNTVPNMIGLTVADARDAWDDAGFDSTTTGFTPDIADDARRVVSQTTDPASSPGVTCLDLAATVDIVTGDPFPAPPPAPCRVPNLINQKRDAGQTAWVDAGFEAVKFNPGNGGFTIKSQTLVGGNYVTCEASITVAASAN